MKHDQYLIENPARHGLRLFIDLPLDQFQIPVAEPIPDKMINGIGRRVEAQISHGQIQRLHRRNRSEEHTSELQSLMRNSYAVFCLKKKHTKSCQYDNTKYDTHTTQCTVMKTRTITVPILTSRRATIHH